MLRYLWMLSSLFGKHSKFYMIQDSHDDDNSSEEEEQEEAVNSDATSDTELEESDLEVSVVGVFLRVPNFG